MAVPPSLHAALVAVGDELLLGRTVDTNAAWLGRMLADLGVPVLRRYTVADDLQEIQGAVAGAVEVAELVVVTGGLGPTPDDLTRDAVAELCRLPLDEDPEVLERIRARFRERGVDELPLPNRRVAQVPRGAVTLANPHGTAPGLALQHQGSTLVLLPGVPREMKGIFQESLAPYLASRFAGRLRPVHARTIYTTGIPESLLSQRIAEALPGGTGAVGLAFLPDVLGVDLRFTARDAGGDEAARAFDTLEDGLGEILAPWRVDAPGGDPAEAVLGRLRGLAATLAVAESCTGGLIAKRLTDVPGASDAFLGGVVSYDNQVKISSLGVSDATLASHGAVSRAVALEMARGVARALSTDFGVGITGVAGPGGGTEEKPVGTVWLAVCGPSGEAVRRERFPGDRREVRERAAQAALFLLLRFLDGRVTPDDPDADGGTPPRG